MFKRTLKRFQTVFLKKLITGIQNPSEIGPVSNWDEWRFVQKDDIKFADRFEEYCKENDLPDSIDVLFIDTNHLYEYTKAEIKH